MKLVRYIAIFIFLLLPLFSLCQGFTPGAFIGIVASQVDGDRLTGYNKPGAYFGILTKYKLSEKEAIQTEIEFIQKGSRQVAQADPLTYEYKIILNYIEVPILYQYTFKKKYTPEAGLGFAYLLNSNTESLDGLKHVSDPAFKKYEYSIILGLNYKLLEKLKINMRYSYSIFPIRSFPGASYLNYNISQFYFDRPQYNNLVSFGIYYSI